MKIRHLPFLIWYSIKGLFTDLADALSALKKAKTWSAVLYAAFFLAFYYRNLEVMKYVLPLIILLYVVRQNKEPEFNKALKERAFLVGDEELMRKYYHAYKKKKHFSNKDAKSYEQYKNKMIKKFKGKKYIENEMGNNSSETHSSELD